MKYTDHSSYVLGVFGYQFGTRKWLAPMYKTAPTSCYNYEVLSPSQSKIKEPIILNIASFPATNNPIQVYVLSCLINIWHFFSFLVLIRHDLAAATFSDVDAGLISVQNESLGGYSVKGTDTWYCLILFMTIY